MLLVKFGTELALDQASAEITDRDGHALNEPLVPREVRQDQSGRKCSINFALPIHKILGTQFKFFIDAIDTSLVSDLVAYLKGKRVLPMSVALHLVRRSAFTLRLKKRAFKYIAPGMVF